MQSLFRIRHIADCVLGLYIAATLTSASDLSTPKEESRHASFKAESHLILVPLSVTDSKGGIIRGLTRDSFTISGNKEEQRIYSFDEQDVPVSIGFIFDLSGSMKYSLADAKAALRALLDDSNPEDEGFLYTVSSRPQQTAGFTGDPANLGNRIIFSQAGGSTALIDTVYAGLKQIHSSKYARKSLVVISDGMDNHSRHSRHELLMEAAESGVAIYCLSLDNASGNLKAQQMEEARSGLSLLSDLAEQTGGLSFVVRNGNSTERAAERIGRAIRSEYLIGYIPRATGSAGGWRSIRVKINRHGLRVHARAGYYLE